ncbi:MAG: N-acetylneuraminate synthase [Pelagimonas sp.]|jgi:N-acetylneuraminate synthase|nr:N-acetylneuraminate synthase [Pelagimonas sp.]
MNRNQTLIIAEAGVNHNGDLGMAFELVEQAARAGADLVKFQTFDPEALASAKAPKAAYQTRQTGGGESQLDMLRKLALSHDDTRALMAHCETQGIGFLSSPFDLGSLQFLTEGLGLQTLKLGSGEMTNAPILLAAVRSGAHVILSTGMASLAEVEEALGVLAFGLMSDAAPATRADFSRALCDPDARQRLVGRVTLMHCTTEYPAAVEDTNLRAVDTLSAAFGLPVGYSDHTEGPAISLAAVARGAKMIEKHFTLDRTLPGPDHAASVEPDELTSLVRDIRRIESALGDGVKQPSGPEIRNRAVARKALHAARDLPAGHMLTDRDIAVKRPGTGPSPMTLWDRIGTTLDRDLSEGDLLP